ncbi:hypothetical protein D9615_007402 [Tricholomella constricta]|uniref:Methyltransferase ausD n=1 Tax=Tricholomella constricta TaxID=117010 RepID=A0A8H5GY05_9AGAR|nr:hypothetical protein D9615_007402 [Tricholomella constricta]
MSEVFLTKSPLEERLYTLSVDDFAFLKAQTRIEDENMMKQHIIAIQRKAYEIYGYPCIRSFAFAKSKISHLPAYPIALELCHKRPGALFLDIGCCFGSDVRKIVADGWPVQNTIASDLRQGFWDLGHELFKSTPDTFPALFIAGDAFDSQFIAPREPFIETPHAQPSLGPLTSLTPLQGHVSVIHASAFFHLFLEEDQLELARRVASLLSPLPGSFIFGAHVGRPEKGILGGDGPDQIQATFCHSPESWRGLWDGQVFKNGTVTVDVELVRRERPDLAGPPIFMLIWSVTRV